MIIINVITASSEACSSPSLLKLSSCPDVNQIIGNDIRKSSNRSGNAGEGAKDNVTADAAANAKMKK